MLFPITTLCVLACIYAARRHERRSPFTLALYPWAMSLVLSAPILYTYSVKYSLKADAFIAACLLIATLFYLVFRARPRTAPEGYTDLPRERRVATIMGGLGVVGSLLLLADAHASGLQFSVSYLLNNLGSIRVEGFSRIAEAHNRGAVGTLGGLAAPSGVLCILAAVKLGRDGDARLRAVAAANALLIVPVSLGVFAGRATIVNVGLLVVISLYLSRRHLVTLRPGTVLSVAFAVVGVWYLSTSWYATREDNPSTIHILEKTQRAELRPWLASVVSGDASTSYAMISLGYFASPMPTFHYYVGAPSPVPGPYWGAYSLPLPARFVGTIAGTWTREQWYDMREEIYAPIYSRGYFDNVWATLPRDLLVDFGYIGGVAFFALFGAFMAWARNSSQRTGALHYHYFEVIACFVLGFGAFTSFIWDAFIAQAFFMSFVVMFLVRATLAHHIAPGGEHSTARQ